MNIKELQGQIKNFCKKNKINHKPEIHALDLTSEIGEISKEILKMSNYGKKSIRYSEEIKGELGDALYSLIALANNFNIDLEEALQMVIKKYENRLAKGSAGSEND